MIEHAPPGGAGHDIERDHAARAATDPGTGGGASAGPGSVYVPLHGLPDGGEAVCELRSLVDGRLALLVYESAEELVECCGRAQPWMEVLADRVDELRAATGAEVVVPGLSLPAELRHEAEGRQ